MLAHEFHDSFSDIFGPRTNIYKKIVEVLANGPLEPKKISNILGVSYTGTQNDYLEDLVISGFVKRDYTWHFSTGKVSRFSQFSLSDNYVRFYLKYIDPILPKIENNTFDFASLSALPGWDTIKGYQYENLVLKNRRFIIECLNINPNDIVSDNRFLQRANKEVSSCQIDYLIQNTYRVLYVCEFKFTSKPIGKQVIRDIQEKMQKLSYPKGFSVLPVLVHVNSVEDEITNSGFFAKVIDFSKALLSEQN
jgi:hypothetical protein